jgi:hypothetical protein
MSSEQGQKHRFTKHYTDNERLSKANAGELMFSEGSTVPALLVVYVVFLMLKFR